MHADSSAARLGWPGRRAKASSGRRTVFRKCGAAFQGAFEGGRTKSNEGAHESRGGAHKHRRRGGGGGAAPRYVALANSLPSIIIVLRLFYSSMQRTRAGSRLWQVFQ